MPKAGLQFNKQDEYWTPDEVWDDILPHIDYDPCTTDAQAKKHGILRYDTIQTDGLKRDWTQFSTIYVNPPFCIAYDTEDEVLTKDGWKKYLEISKDDLILSVGSSKQLEYVGIEEIVYQEYTGRMVSYSYPRGTKSALTVTYNHRCVTDEGFVRAEDLKEGDYYTDGYIWGETDDRRKKVLPEVDTSYWSKNRWGRTFVRRKVSEKEIGMEDWARFLGLWIADGSIIRGKNPVTGKQKYSIYVGQNCERENRVLDIMTPLGFKVHKTKSYSRPNYFHYYIHSVQLWRELEQYGKSDSKFIPREILDGGANVLEAFLEGYMFGDSYRSGNGFMLSTRSSRLAKDLQELCLKLGKICHCSRRKCEYKRQSLPYYQIYLREANDKLSYHQIKKIDDYSGKIFCLHLVKNHNFFVKHDGYISNTGNTRKFEFLKKAVDSIKATKNQRIYFLIPIDSLPTKKFHDVVGDAKYVLILPNGRIKFDDGSGKKSSPAFGSVILLFSSLGSSRRVAHIQINNKKEKNGEAS